MAGDVVRIDSLERIVSYLDEGTSGTRDSPGTPPFRSYGNVLSGLNESDLEDPYPYPTNAATRQRESAAAWDLRNLEICVNALLVKMKGVPKFPTGAIVRQPSIWRVPSQLRGLDPGAYEPMLVSIGPLHRGKSVFSPMEKVKLENLLYFQGEYPEFQLERYFKVAFNCLKDAKDEYSEDTYLSDNEFVEMLVVDGCFIIAYLLGNAYPAVASATLIPHVRWRFDHLSRDILLLENQIPFFVVDALFKEAVGVLSRIWDIDGDHLDIVKLALRFLNIELPIEIYPKIHEVKHLLHLQHLAQDPGRLSEIPYLHSCWHLSTSLVKNLYKLIAMPFLGLLYLVLFWDCYGLVGA